jgi:hypothetical protein
MTTIEQSESDQKKYAKYIDVFLFLDSSKEGSRVISISSSSYSNPFVKIQDLF